MNRRPEADDVVEAAQAVASLNAEADRLRVEIDRMRQQLAELRRDQGSAQAAELIEANGQLVLSALHAEQAAETAAGELEELTHSSQRDPLTGLPTRAVMLDRLEHAIALAGRHQGRAALLFVDLDRFKQINDTLGHAAGDDVLRLCAKRLASVLRSSDTVSRHGGDEFLVVLPEIAHACDAGAVAAKMLAAIAGSARIGNQTVHLSASVGIAIYPEDGHDAQTLIGGADAAMYRSKRHAAGGFAFHDGGGSRPLAGPA